MSMTSKLSDTESYHKLLEIASVSTRKQTKSKSDHDNNNSDFVGLFDQTNKHNSN